MNTNNSPTNNDPDASGKDEAIDLIKQRIRQIYGDDNVGPQEKPHSELVARFWNQHKDHPDPQSAWQQFYNNLSDSEKTSLWNEYEATSNNQSTQPDYTSHISNPLANSQSQINVNSFPIDQTQHKQDLLNNLKSVTKHKKKIAKSRVKKSKNHWRPLIYSVLAMLLWTLAQYNPLIIAFAKQYVSPGNTLKSPVIIDPNSNIKISKEPRIIIPKINVDVPVVYSLGTRDEKAIQNALEDGVVHYDQTSLPGQAGNNVIVGHSSNNFLNSGKYKFAFVLLDRLELGDTFVLHYKSTRYIYKVTNKQVVKPNDFSLTLPTSKPTTTLITCTPPGTSWRRLIVQAEQISPSVTQKQTDPENIPKQVTEHPVDAIIPSNAPSFFQKVKDWIF